MNSTQNPQPAVARYSTLDLYQAAYCHAKGFAVEAVPVSASKCRFDLPIEASAAGTEYACGGLIRATAYAESIKLVKRLATRRR